MASFARGSYKAPAKAAPLPKEDPVLQFPPSGELLEYYRKRIAEFEKEREEAMALIERTKLSQEQQHRYEWEINKKNNELFDLQQSVSDAQIFLFQERENALRLRNSVDELKIKELEDRKKMKLLLALSEPNEHEITYFFKTQKKNLPSDRMKRSRGNKENKDRNTVESESLKEIIFDGIEAFFADQEPDESLKLRILSLEEQLQEKDKIHKDQIQALLNDRKVRMENEEVRHAEYSKRIEEMTTRLKDMQGLLFDSTRDFLELKQKTQMKEKQLMERSNTEHQKFKKKYKQISNLRGNLVKETESYVQEQKEQAEAMIGFYQKQALKLDSQLKDANEKYENMKLVSEKKNKILNEQLENLENNYKKLEERRKFEKEGYENDIQILKRQFVNMEKQLCKFALSEAEKNESNALNTIHETATRSKRLAGELHHLKSKVYSIENDLRYVPTK
eukprot:Nk52_evm22s1401 gene=Nk52_evmTU22s1401